MSGQTSPVGMDNVILSLELRSKALPATASGPTILGSKDYEI